MNRLTQSRNKLQHFKFPDLGRNIQGNNMANDAESVASNNDAVVDGGPTSCGTVSANAPEQWCKNLMYGDFNPRTSQGRDNFTRKTKSLAEDKKFKVLTKDAGMIRKYLIGKHLSLGETCCLYSSDVQRQWSSHYISKFDSAVSIGTI